MKNKHLVVAVALVFSVTVFAQKDEFKTLKKIYDKDVPTAKEITDYVAAANIAEPLVAAGTDADKVYLNFYKSNIPLMQYNNASAEAGGKKNSALALEFFTTQKVQELVNAYNATLAFEKTAGKEIVSKRIQQNLNKVKAVLIGLAIDLGTASKYKESSQILYNVYLLDKKDVEKLYFAAGYAINGQDYDSAIAYYNELITLNYSGEKTVYYAKSVLTDNEENFETKEQRDRFVTLKTHKDPREEKITSKRGEIYKNVALINQSQGKIEDAKRVFKEAVKLNPDDTGLMLSEANLYLETKDLATYKSLVSEILAKEPSNSELYYNLGVIANNNKEFAEAETMYKKAIELDPKNGNANLNMAIIKLDAEKDIIAQMNKLGNTPADDKKYAVLKTKRNALLQGALPYLEAAVEIDLSNKDAATTLISVYKALEFMDKAKALKARVDAAK